MTVLQWGPQWRSQSILWQQHSSRLFLQTGRNSFHLTVQQSAGIILSSRPVCDSPYSNPSSWSKECDNGCTVSNQQSQSYRMEDSPRNFTQSVFCLRDPPPPTPTPTPPPPPPPPPTHTLVDMLATAENKVTPVYVSPYPDNRAWVVDALFTSWDGLGQVYAFPPAPIVHKTLQKIKLSHGTTVILIASQHSSQLWHPLLPHLSLHPHLPLTDITLFQYTLNIRRPQFHRDPRLLDLAAWLLSRISPNVTTSQTP